MQWRIGDLVQLKSGGPTMTVTSLIEDSPTEAKVICTWYVEDERIQEPFDPATLKAAKPSD
jgi:uncharacterized protein YodC (DUF2158 family)